MEDFPRLDIPRLRREGQLVPGTTRKLGWRIEGELTAVELMIGEDGMDVTGLLGELKHISASLPFEWAQLKFGRRPYVRCPRCQCRVAKLLLTVSGVFCRTCSTLPYKLAVMSPTERLQEKRLRAREALHYDEHGVAHRPRYMRLDRWMQLHHAYRSADLDVFESLGIDVAEERQRIEWMRTVTSPSQSAQEPLTAIDGTRTANRDPAASTAA